MAVIKHSNISNVELRSLIRQGKINFGGNRKLKIYGLLKCKSGKRMKKENRVFFCRLLKRLKIITGLVVIVCGWSIGSGRLGNIFIIYEDLKL